MIYDKAPAPAPVGSGLIVQPSGQAVLRALDLLEALQARGARLDRLDGRLEDGRRKVLDVRYAALGEDVHGVSVHRSVLFNLLRQGAERAGAAFEHGRDVAGIEQSEAGPMVIFADGDKSGRFDFAIDAAGVRSPLVERVNAFLDYGALWANAPFPHTDGFDARVLAQRYRSADTSSGVMPIGGLKENGEPLAAFFWTLRADRYQAWRDAPLDQWKQEALALWPALAPVLDHFTGHDQFVFAHYAHHTAQRPVEGRMVHIGDAWHAASPQLGQGANMALLDAAALWRAFERTTDVEMALDRFIRMRRNHVRLYQLMSGVFTPVYQSDLKILPALRDVFAGPLSAAPPMPRVLAAMVSGTLGAPLERLGLKNG